MHSFALDLGTNSIGWAVLQLNEDYEPFDIIESGVRIFPDGRNPKDGSSLSGRRREKRGERRLHDRFLRRQKGLIQTFISSGIWPTDEKERKSLEAKDPYFLRATALDEKLQLAEFGRALFHLNKRRGFKSNRLAPIKDNEEETKIATGIVKLSEKMETVNARTYGEFLHKERLNGNTVRIRAGVDFYPSREILEKEFQCLWTAQSKHYPNILTTALHDKIHRQIFHQRPLRPVTQGTCTFEPNILRCPKAHPLFQRFRMWQEVNNLAIEYPHTELTLEDRQKVFSHLEW
jgi:CRISPR-associated endonuclease Csn1